MMMPTLTDSGSCVGVIEIVNFKVDKNQKIIINADDKYFLSMVARLLAQQIEKDQNDEFERKHIQIKEKTNEASL